MESVYMALSTVTSFLSICRHLDHGQAAISSAHILPSYEGQCVAEYLGTWCFGVDPVTRYPSRAWRGHVAQVWRPSF